MQELESLLRKLPLAALARSYLLRLCFVLLLYRL
jgi:hypothetical protein